MENSFCPAASIIDVRARTLVSQLDQTSCSQTIDQLLQKLMVTLDQNCRKSDVRARYEQYRSQPSIPMEAFDNIEPYPLDEEGFAISFDPLEEEQEFWHCWYKHGFVISKSAISKDTCLTTIKRIQEILSHLSNQRFDLNRPDTFDNAPVDEQNVSCLSRGFFEVYHDDSLAQLRQAIRVYLHHVLIWGRVDLWTSFDRFGLKLAGHEESKGLPLHVDQNPMVQPHFETIQGVLALTDCPIDRGTFRVVPQSRWIFPEYRHLVNARDDDYRGEYVEAIVETPLAQILYRYAQAIPLRAGDFISWDSRTTHANTPNLSQHNRIVAYIAAGPAVEDNEQALASRRQGLQDGLGRNVRGALMHASMPPRYAHPSLIQEIRRPESLTYLGKRLYGVERYAASL